MLSSKRKADTDETTMPASSDSDKYSNTANLVHCLLSKDCKENLNICWYEPNILKELEEFVDTEGTTASLVQQIEGACTQNHSINELNIIWHYLEESHTKCIEKEKLKQKQQDDGGTDTSRTSKSVSPAIQLLAAFSALPNLQHLEISLYSNQIRTDFLVEGLSTLTKNSKIKSLRFHGCKEVARAGSSRLWQRSSQQSLPLRSMFQAMVALPGMTSLERFGWSAVTGDETLNSILLEVTSSENTLPNLKALNISANNAWFENKVLVEPDGLRSLAKSIAAASFCDLSMEGIDFTYAIQDDPDTFLAELFFANDNGNQPASLERLNLQKCDLPNGSASRIIDWAMSNDSLKTLRLGLLYQEKTPGMFQKITQIVRTHKQLVALGIDDCSSSSSGLLNVATQQDGQDLMAALATNTTLVSFKASANFEQYVDGSSGGGNKNDQDNDRNTVLADSRDHWFLEGLSHVLSHNNSLTHFNLSNRVKDFNIDDEICPPVSSEKCIELMDLMTRRSTTLKYLYCPGLMTQELRGILELIGEARFVASDVLDSYQTHIMTMPQSTAPMIGDGVVRQKMMHLLSEVQTKGRRHDTITTATVFWYFLRRYPDLLV